MNTLTRLFLLVVFSIGLVACRLDVNVSNSDNTSTADKVVGFGGSSTTTNFINCSEGNTGDCYQVYKPVGGCTGLSNCTEVGASGVDQTLAAVPAEGNTFSGWGGACGLGASFCNFTVGASDAASDNQYSVDANFGNDVTLAAITRETYDEQGRRSSKTAGGVTVYYTYDPAGHLVGEYKTVSGAVVPIREYVWLDNKLFAQYDYTANVNSPVLNYYVNDHLGTPVYMLDSSGNMNYELAGAPFGENVGEFKVTGTDQPVRFPGQYRDLETGFNQNWNRDYDPSIGRYLQSDPIGLEGGINTYAYVGQNPVMRLDPKGLDFESDLSGVIQRGTGIDPRKEWNTPPGKGLSECEQCKLMSKLMMCTPIKSGMGALGNVAGGAIAVAVGGDAIVGARAMGTIVGYTGGKAICDMIKTNCDSVCKDCEK